MNSLSGLQRLGVLGCVCWISFAYIVSQDGYGGFSGGTFFMLGIFPLLFILGALWTYKGFSKEYPALNTKIGGIARAFKFGPQSKFSPFVLASWLAGFLTARYFGQNLVIPAIVFVVTFAAFKRFDKNFKYSNTSRCAIAILFGHFIWITAGGVFAGDFSSVAVDLFIMALACIGLVHQPENRFYNISIIGFEIFGIMYNYSALEQTTDLLTISLHTHITLRLGVVICSLLAMRNKRLTTEARIKSDAA